MTSFSANVKKFLSDFKVIEIDKNGIPCHDLASQEEYNQSKFEKSLQLQSLNNAEPFTKKQMLEENNSIFVESKHVVASHSISNDNNSTEYGLSLNEEDCREKLSALLPAEHLSYLQEHEFSIQDDLTSKLELYSLGLFKCREDRKLIHHCIRFLYPHLTTVS